MTSVTGAGNPATTDTDWQPTASLGALRERARQLAYVRDFFARRGVLEVETPVLSHCGVTDVNIDSVAATVLPVPGHDGRAGWLQPSPEYHMKRLLAAGSGSIYQVYRAFRDGERGRRHNPEFSLLEWYRTGITDTELMAEVADLVCGWLDCPRPGVLSYGEAMHKYVGIDPFTISDTALIERCGPWVDAALAAELGRDGCLDLLLSHELEPALREQPPVFICHYPASQAALAKISVVNGVEVAHRFELYVAGIELCNGYWELTDAGEQRQRFTLDNQQRSRLGKPVMPVDELLVQALEAGLPECSGVALGLDRLLMLKLGADSIADVLAFPFERA
ncbi:EF-P lysine aminoacylase EpmA [Marinobacter sp. X15-166B]|uniref:EF-P lysine aminoacylase EpmA n=1 Tax=Marinobacter sp. X15-166B TaxID=1897620 RepID=UPI00085C7050|nr:EF-P lysine aminoacylase EpmA [Marinobacter sp. X15-166B]OEY65253.1 EF-P lysine aminoacylase GenX [Marinobacter sp. X15-166B]